MNGFKFGLQKVLDLRIWRENETASRLGAARRQAEEAQHALELLEEIRADRSEQLLGAHRMHGTVGQLQNLSFMLEQIDAQIEQAEARKLEADQEVEASLSEYTEASRERQVLEKLRERKLEATRAEARRSEQRTMDEIALGRHTRPEPGSPPKGTT